MFNIFFLCFLAVGFAIGLSIFITRSKSPTGGPLVPPEDDYANDPQDRPPLTMADLQRLAEHLCATHALKINEKIENSPHENYWIAESKNDFFFGNYVFCFSDKPGPHPFVVLTDLLEFKDFVKSMQSTKGFFFTNGYFTRDVHQPLEGPKVVLYNRIKVLEELDRLPRVG
jgi:hypothetical protein